MLKFEISIVPTNVDLSKCNDHGLPSTASPRTSKDINSVTSWHKSPPTLSSFLKALSCSTDRHLPADLPIYLGIWLCAFSFPLKILRGNSLHHRTGRDLMADPSYMAALITDALGQPLCLLLAANKILYPHLPSSVWAKPGQKEHFCHCCASLCIFSHKEAQVLLCHH